MGYGAYGGGQVTLRTDELGAKVVVPDKVLAQLTLAEFLVEDSPDGGLWLTFEFGTYNDQIEPAIIALAPYVKAGNVVFHGEDNEHWRFEFENGKLWYANGQIEYKRSFEMVRKRSFNIGFTRFNAEKDDYEGDETQFDVDDQPNETLYAELMNLFTVFCEEDNVQDWTVDYVEEVPYSYN